MFAMLLVFYAYMILAVVFIVTLYEVCRELQGYMVFGLRNSCCNNQNQPKQKMDVLICLVALLVALVALLIALLVVTNHE